MRKMPPLPNRKIQANNPTKPLIEIISNKLVVPQRYNSIERVIRDTKKDFED